MGRKSRRPVGPTARTERTIALARGPDSADRGPALLASSVLLLVGAVIYFNGLNTPFLLDDVPSIVQNPYIRSLWPPWHLVHAPENTIATARPLVSLSLAVNHATSGLDVRAYRLTNIAIHLMAAMVLFGVVRRTVLAGALRERFGAHAAGIAFAGALLWMTHPLQTEAVNYISQRTESMMGLFYFLTLYCAIRADSESPNSRAWIGGAIGACAAGMASKQVMVTAPIMVVLWDWAFLGEPFREVLARRWRLYAGLAATWLLLAVLTITFRDTNAGMGVTPFDYVFSQCKVILQYLRRAIWPTGLIFDYGLARATPFSEVAPYAALLALLLALTVFALIRYPVIGFLGAWTFLILAPTSSVLPLFTEVGAERRMYVPLAGMVMLVVGGVYLLAARLGEGSGAQASAPLGTAKRRGLALLTLVVAGTFCWLTVQRNRQYLDPLALWTSVVAAAPENYRGRNNLGVALQQAGREAEAIEEFRVALQQNPDFGPAHHNLGKSLHEAGNFDEAIDHYEAALRIDGSGQLHADLGAALEAVGRTAEATEHYEIALKLDPSDVDAHLNVGRSYFARQQPEEAIRHYREALRLQPRDVRVHTVLGTALASLGNHEEALAEYQLALQIDPDYEPAQRNMGSTLVAQGRPDEALAHFRAMVERRPTDFTARRLLALTLTSQGRTGDAVAEHRAIIATAGTASPAAAVAHRDLGDLFLDDENLPGAIDEYRQAVAARPDDPEAHFGLGFASALSGRVADAVEHMERAVALAPEWPDALSQLAWLLSGAGGPSVTDHDRAIELAERAAQLTGGQDPGVLQVVAAAYQAAGRVRPSPPAATAPPVSTPR